MRESTLSSSHSCRLSIHLSISRWPNYSQMVACQDERLRSCAVDTSTATVHVENWCLLGSFSTCAVHKTTKSESSCIWPQKHYITGTVTFSRPTREQMLISGVVYIMSLKHRRRSGWTSGGDAWRAPKVDRCRVRWGMGRDVSSPAD